MSSASIHIYRKDNKAIYTGNATKTTSYIHAVFYTAATTVTGMYPPRVQTFYYLEKLVHSIFQTPSLGHLFVTSYSCLSASGRLLGY